MTVASLLTLIQVLVEIGSISTAIINVKKDLETRKRSDPAPLEHVLTVKDALISGTAWEADHGSN